mgnify:FL=1
MVTETEYISFVTRLKDTVFRLARSILTDSHLAQDVTQDVFARVWLQRESILHSQHPRAYTCRIASIAASVVAVAGITLAILLTPIESEVAEPMIVCHINGTMVDDQLIAQAEVQRILGGVSKNMHTAKERIDNITRITSNKQL